MFLSIILHVIPVLSQHLRCLDQFLSRIDSSLISSHFHLSLETWRALVDIWHNGGARSIGVSNYEIIHLQEIIDAGMPLPAINQIPLNISRSTTHAALISFCKAHGIVVNAYSPLGVPDWHTYPTKTGMSPHLLDDPVLVSIAAAHPPFTAAQVAIAWLWQSGFPTNPRTMRGDHMDENLSALTLKLSDAEMRLLSSRPQSTCDIDDWYECAPVS